MTVDMEKMRKAHEATQKGGDFIGFENGETLVYIHPPCREGDEWAPTTGLNYVPVTVHYGVGKNNAMAVSLDPDKNPIVTHPWIKQILKKRKVRLTGECPMGKALADGTLSDDEADEARAQTRFLWGMTPLKRRGKSTEPWLEMNGKPSVAFIGKQIFDGVMEAFFDNGDISDPDGAILLRIKKSGEKRTTKYEVKVEPATLKKAFVLPKALRKALATAMAEGGECDLFRIVGNMIKSPAEVQAMIDGVKVDSDASDFDDDEDDEEPTPPKGKKGKKAPPPEDDDEEEDDDDDEEEDEDDEPPPPKKGAKKKPEPEEEEDEDEDDEPPPPKKTAKKAPPPEDDEDEDDEPPPPKKGKAKPEKPSKKPPKDEDDDLELGDLEGALADLEDEDDEDPKASKKSSKKAPPPDEDDDEPEEDDEDEDDEPPPPKKTGKKK